MILKWVRVNPLTLLLQWKVGVA